METSAHRNLKRLAIAYLRSQNYQAVAIEVRCPISRFRVDVAGWSDHPAQSKSATTLFELNGSAGACPCNGQITKTIMIECKQSRADFLRDGRDIDTLIDRRERLERIRNSIEEYRIKTIEPHLRRSGSSLFAEMELWDFGDSRLRSYQSTMKRIERVEKQLYGQTKFCLAVRYSMADQLYIAAPRGLIRRRELPKGWGLLQCSRRLLEHDPGTFKPGFAAMLRVCVPSPNHDARDDRQARLLRNIAVAASRDAYRRWQPEPAGLAEARR